MTSTVTRRILARVENPDDAFPEMEWVIRYVTRDGSLKAAVRSVQAEIDDGSMIVVREEPVR